MAAEGRDVVARAVSISLGSSRRDSQSEVDFGGKRVSLERIGTDGNADKFTKLFKELDGSVDALGVGGAVLSLHCFGRSYPLHSVQRLVQVQKTPVVDGSGVKTVIESKVAQAIEDHRVAQGLAKRVLICCATDRYSMAKSFIDEGYEVIVGDLGFVLGIPLSLRSPRMLDILSRFILPFASHFPISWLYPTGKKQEKRTVAFQSWYDWATVVAGDYHYIKAHMPKSLSGKIIATNTTTEDDVKELRQRGISALCTTTPRFGGRSFGTNVLEAGLTAAAGKGRLLCLDELRDVIQTAGIGGPHMEYFE